MKHLLLSLLVFASSSVFANSVELFITPQRPLVINADLITGTGTDQEKIIKGPWFKGYYTVINKSSEVITVYALDFTVTSVEGQGLRSIEVFDKPHEVAPGEAIQFKDIVTYNFAKSESLEYKVNIRLLGWSGADQEKRLTTQINIVTQ